MAGHDEHDRSDGDTLRICVLDIATTGLDPVNTEVIGVGLCCVQVDRAQGTLLAQFGTAFEWQEPRSLSSEAQQQLAGIQLQELRGLRFDRSRIDSLLAQADLVVAHDADFKWQLTVPLFPQLADLPWACSLHNIDWRDGQGVKTPIIARLQRVYGLGSTDGTPEGNCRLLVRLLSMPLPRSKETGFRRLIAAAAEVTVVCVVDDAERRPGRELAALGFKRQPWRLAGRWMKSCANAATALQLECRLIDLAVGDPTFASLRMWRVDAVDRISSSIPRAAINLPRASL